MKHLPLRPLCNPNTSLRPLSACQGRAGFSISASVQAAIPESQTPHTDIAPAPRELSEEEVTKLFGRGTDRHDANKGVRVIQTIRLERALQGTDKLPLPSGYGKQFTVTAVRWLQANYPFDGDTLDRLRAERRQQEQERLLSRAERLGIYQPQQGVRHGNVYGDSGLDAIRQHYQRQPVKEYKAKNTGQSGRTDLGRPDYRAETRGAELNGEQRLETLQNGSSTTPKQLRSRPTQRYPSSRPFSD